MPRPTQELDASLGTVGYGTLTLSGRSLQNRSPNVEIDNLLPYGYRALQPRETSLSVWATPRSLATTSGMISLPRGTEMFQFPRCPPPNLWIQLGSTGGSLPWVTPFGNLRINACRRLPAAYRSLPRPSSAFGAKASTIRPV